MIYASAGPPRFLQFCFTASLLILLQSASSRAGEIEAHAENRATRSIDVAMELNNRGSAFEDSGKFRESEAVLRESYSTLKQANLLNGPLAGSVLSNLGLSIQKQGRLGEAAALYESACEILRRSPGDRSLEYARALSNWALVNYQTARYLDSLQQNRQALEIENSLPDGQALSEKAKTLNNLGATLLQLDRFQEADSVFRQSLSVRKAGGLDHGPKFAETLNNLAVLERRMGRLAQARQDSQQARNILTSEGKADDPVMAEVLNTLASLQAKQKRHKQAQALYEEALRIDTAYYGQGHPRIASDLTNIAAQVFYQKRPLDSAALYEKAERIQEKFLAQGDLAAAATLHNLGVLYADIKQFDQASAAYDRAIHIMENASTHDDAALSLWLHEYAIVLKHQQRFGEAEQAEVQALGIQVRSVIKTKT